MNLVSLASHTVDLDLLPEAPIVLDAGCRWFDFTKAVSGARPSASIVAMDPAEDVTFNNRGVAEARERGIDAVVKYVSAALVGRGQAQQRLAHFSTGEGDFLTTQGYFPGWDKQPDIYEVECLTIKELMLQEGVKHWDLVKLDIEGSEFEVLENWPGAIATQISVEFHDWDKPSRQTQSYYDGLMQRLPWYRMAQHEFTKQGTSYGHWDSLLVLR